MGRLTAVAMLVGASLVAGCGSGKLELARQHALDRLVREQDGPPGVVAIVRDPGGTWIGVSGLADVDAHAPVQADDRFRIGSVTKTFVAAAVLQLVREGKLALDDTVERRLPGLLPRGGEITVRQLLSHTSGLPDYVWEPGVVEGLGMYEPITRTPREEIALVADQPPGSPPGTRFSYSSTGYLVLGLIVEQATGRSLAEELERTVFEPLGLEDTKLASGARIDGRHAHGYAPDGRDVTDQPIDWSWAAGGIVSTASDVGDFFAALLGGRLLEPRLLEEMKTTVPSENGHEYGLGIARAPSACGLVWRHTGGVPGYQSVALASDDGSRVVVLLGNSVVWFGDPRERFDRTAEELFCS